ncbi:tol-pal system protein YbgF [Azospirillum sp.]|uniref:tol-pal system protein YbgF n=1 Tax=Azospirillum sp. TaxID=34012 RepID=UPI003D7331A6
MKTTTRVAALLLGGVFWIGPAHAEGIADRLERLESQLGLQVAESTQVAQMAPSLAADFEVRLQRLERAVSELTGRYEESTYQSNQLKDRLERLNADIDFRLQQLEKGGGAGGAGAVAAAAPEKAPEKPAAAPAAGQLGSTKPTEKPAAGPQVAALPANATPDKQYEHAFEQLRNGHYDVAEKEFSTFIAKNKAHNLTGSAQYWLGETYYVRNRFGEAAASFGEVLQKYPKGNKAPDALLKLGLSLASLNKKTEACTALGQMNKMYPDAAPSVKRRSEMERKKLNCG